MSNELLSTDHVPNASTAPKRLNKLPMALFISVTCVLVCGMAYMVNKSAEAQSLPKNDPLAASKDESNVSALPLAMETIQNERESRAKKAIALVPPPLPAPPIPNFDRYEPGAGQSSYNQQLRPSSRQLSAEEAAQAELENQIRRSKFEAFRNAVSAPTKVDIPPSGQQFAANNSYGTASDARLADIRQKKAANAQLMTDYQRKLQEMRSGNMASGSASAVAGTGKHQSILELQDSGNNQNSTSSASGSRWDLNTEIHAPKTPFVLRSDTIIPGTLISGINSELPGTILAQVNLDVYDTATGKYLLIPAGSKIQGVYATNIQYGQNAVMVAWQRILFPDGKDIDIGEMAGSDVAGYAGFRDKVNHHYLRLFGSSFLMSGIVAGINLSQNSSNNNGDSQRAGDAMSEALGQTMGMTLSQVIAKNLNVSPTIEIRPGYNFNIIAAKDISFPKAYEPFDY